MSASRLRRRRSTSAQARVAALAVLLALFPGALGARSAGPGAHAYFVAPSGSAAGDGSRGAPWDLAGALANARRIIQPGDTVWLRGGTYRGDFRSSLRGTVERPVVVRETRGERATIDGRLDAYGAYTVFWGFEITQSDHRISAQRAVDVRGPGLRFVNLIVHDAAGSGIGFWMEGVDAEVYGCVIYNNGTRSSLDHGIYAINRDGRKSIRDNVVFNNFGYGIHVYGKPSQALNHFDIDGNTVFGSGTISSADRAKPNLLVGGEGIPAEDVTIANNVFYSGGETGVPNVRLGYDPTADNAGLRLLGNTAIGGRPVVSLLRWRDVSARGNVFSGSCAIVEAADSTGDRVDWSGNSSLTSPRATAARPPRSSCPDVRPSRFALAGTGHVEATPKRAQVILRPNRYEPDRATVTVINWPMDSVVDVAVSQTLRPGDHYELRSVEQLFAPPMKSGRYTGGTLAISMRPVPAPPPAPPAITPSPAGPFFGVFLLQRVP